MSSKITTLPFSFPSSPCLLVVEFVRLMWRVKRPPLPTTPSPLHHPPFPGGLLLRLCFVPGSSVSEQVLEVWTSLIELRVIFTAQYANARVLNLQYYCDCKKPAHTPLNTTSFNKYTPLVGCYYLVTAIPPSFRLLTKFYTLLVVRTVLKS